jgi:hypothetical protein
MAYRRQFRRIQKKTKLKKEKKSVDHGHQMEKIHAKEWKEN